MRGLLFALALAGGIAGLASPPLWAAAPVTAAARLLPVADRQISVDQAARIAQQAVGGRVLAAEPANLGGQPVVRVKVLTPDGVVRIVIVDAATGRVR